MKNTRIAPLIYFAAFFVSSIICFLYYHRTYPTVSFTRNDHIAFDPVHDASYLAEDIRPQPIVNINSASAEALAVLPGMNETLAARVVNHRMNFGSYSKLDDIMKVNGITREIFRKLRPYICVDEPN